MLNDKCLHNFDTQSLVGLLVGFVQVLYLELEGGILFQQSVIQFVFFGIQLTSFLNELLINFYDTLNQINKILLLHNCFLSGL